MSKVSIFNKQYMRNPDIFYLLKMEYVPNIYIFGLKMMVKSGLEITPPCAKPFSDLLIHFIKGRIFALIYKFSNKNDMVCPWRDFDITLCGV